MPLADGSDPLSRGKRVLIVSDNLGSPLHQRGIFHYTANLMRAFAACGHKVSLLVEKNGRYGLGRRDRAEFDALSPMASRSVALGEVIRYLTARDGAVPAPRGLRRSIVRRLGWPDEATALISKAGLRLALGRSKPSPSLRIANAQGAVDFLPPAAAYLRVPIEFLLCPAVYSLGFATSAVGITPPTVDARGFDVILIDTPTHLRFVASPGAEIVAVIHDLIPLTDPSAPMIWRKIFARKVASTIAATNSLILVSEATRRRVAEYFPAAAARAGNAILPPSVDEAFGAEAPPAIPPTREYLVAVVSDEPRKNFDGLIEAARDLPPHVGVTIIGQLDQRRLDAWGRGQGPDGARLPDHAARVTLAGYVSDLEKQRLIAGSVGVVMPSFSEGFGIPIIEGFAAGKPVFCSDIPVFREVAGDWALYFDPHRPGTIAAAINRYLQDPAAMNTRLSAARAETLGRFGLAALTDAVGRRFGDARPTR